MKSLLLLIGLFGHHKKPVAPPPPPAHVAPAPDRGPGFMTEWGWVPVPPGTCDVNDSGTFFFVGLDGALTTSTKSCNDAVYKWLEEPLDPPSRLLRA